MSDGPTTDARSKPARRIASRAVYGTFLALATAFILSSTFQIVIAVLGPPSAGPRPEVSTACRDALERGLASLEKEPPAATDGLDRACSGRPHDGEALAAFLRLRTAQEGFDRRRAAELDPLRQDVRAYVSER